MPYVLERVSDNLYFVVTSETGKRHSNKPIPLDRAKAQKRILEQSLRGGATIQERGMAAFLREKYTIPDQGLRAELNGIVHSNNEEPSITTTNARVLDPKFYKAFSNRVTWKGIPPHFVTPTPMELTEGDLPTKGLHGGINAIEYHEIDKKYPNQLIDDHQMYDQWKEIFALITNEEKAYIDRLAPRENFVDFVNQEFDFTYAQRNEPNFGIYGSMENLQFAYRDIRNQLVFIYGMLQKRLFPPVSNRKKSFAPKQARMQGGRVIATFEPEPIEPEVVASEGQLDSALLQETNDAIDGVDAQIDELTPALEELGDMDLPDLQEYAQILATTLNQYRDLVKSYLPNYYSPAAKEVMVRTIERYMTHPQEAGLDQRKALFLMTETVLDALEDERYHLGHSLLGGVGIVGAGSGKWTALIRALGRMYNIPQKIVDATIAINDKKTGSQRFSAKRQNILTQFRDYLDPTVVDEINELENDTVAEYARSLDSRRSVLNLREVQTTNPLALTGEGKVAQRRISQLKNKLDRLKARGKQIQDFLQNKGRREGLTVEQLYETPDGKELRKVEMNHVKLAREFNRLLRIERGQTDAIPEEEEEEEEEEPTNTSARSSGLSAVRMLRTGGTKFQKAANRAMQIQHRSKIKRR